MLSIRKLPATQLVDPSELYPRHGLFLIWKDSPTCAPPLDFVPSAIRAGSHNMNGPDNCNVGTITRIANLAKALVNLLSREGKKKNLIQAKQAIHTATHPFNIQVSQSQPFNELQWIKNQATRSRDRCQTLIQSHRLPLDEIPSVSTN